MHQLFSFVYSITMPKKFNRTHFRWKHRKGKKRHKQLQGHPGTRKKPGLSIVKSPSEFIPDRLFVPMIWSSQFNNPVGGANFTGQIGLGPLFSAGDTGGDAGLPNGSGTVPGLNVLGYHMFELMKNFYNYYRIYNSAIEWEVQVADNAHAYENIVVVCFPTTLAQTNSGNSIGLNVALEQPFVVSRTYNSTKVANKILRNKITVEKMYGISKMQLKTDEQFYGLMNQVIPAQVVWTTAIYDVGEGILQTAPLPANTFCGYVRMKTYFEFFGKKNDFEATD